MLHPANDARRRGTRRQDGSGICSHAFIGPRLGNCQTGGCRRQHGNVSHGPPFITTACQVPASRKDGAFEPGQQQLVVRLPIPEFYEVVHSRMTRTGQAIARAISGNCHKAAKRVN